jgi:hypothetical protein
MERVGNVPLEMLKNIIRNLAEEVVDRVIEERAHVKQQEDPKCHPPTSIHRISLSPVVDEHCKILCTHEKFPILQLEVLKQRDNVRVFFF